MGGGTQSQEQLGYPQIHAFLSQPPGARIRDGVTTPRASALGSREWVGLIDFCQWLLRTQSDRHLFETLLQVLPAICPEVEQPGHMIVLFSFVSVNLSTLFHGGHPIGPSFHQYPMVPVSAYP